jgi:hypothetical protein
MDRHWLKDRASYELLRVLFLIQILCRSFSRRFDSWTASKYCGPVLAAENDLRFEVSSVGGALSLHVLYGSQALTTTTTRCTSPETLLK